jgi:hypothetical protein
MRMHRTQISLEPEQYRRLGDEAERLGISLSALIRRLVDEHFGNEVATGTDPIDELCGMAFGTGEPVGRNHNRYLYGKDAE